ncbi:cysteine synthase family protein [Pendulispora brunnea]|uniref:Cysteine synthase family protein n=1 Tax=Pendulispora brunnea TaxID=2905690 RepID=A0ABZ2KLE6_9BACT
MRNRHPDSSVVDAQALPRIIRLSENLYGAAFTLMKLLPARFMLDRAAAEGRLKPGTTVIETTSGTLGLGLAMICCLRRYPLIIVSDPAIEPPLQRRLEELGARVEIVRTPAPTGGLQGARLARMAELQAEYPEHFWPSQYANPHNPAAYAPFAELVAESVGQVDCLLGTVGSGGSVFGTGAYLRHLFPKMKVVGIDTFGSVLFGQPDQKGRLLRGLGNSIMPKNVDHPQIDEAHWVSAAAGFAATRALHREHALYMGPTSGTAYLVARWWAKQHPDKKAVVIFPDEGYRYQDTVYNDAWLREKDLVLDALPQAPLVADDPRTATGHWASFAWNRRTLQQVLEQAA